MDVLPGVHLIGFTDDLIVLGTAVIVQRLEDLINPTLKASGNWMASIDLELAHQKNEVVVISRRRAFMLPRLTVGGHQITILKKN